MKTFPGGFAQAGRCRPLSVLVCAALLCALAGCALPDKPVQSAVYDFGPGPLPGATARAAATTPIGLAEIETVAALDSTALLYRLGYADAQQRRAYTLARWSMPPALLLQQRVRERLAGSYAVLGSAQAAALRGADNAAPVLRLELEGFSHWFNSPGDSVGLLRLRATVTQTTPQGEQLLGQRSFSVQRPAPGADAAGGVRALSAASDAAIDELMLWLAALRP